MFINKKMLSIQIVMMYNSDLKYGECSPDFQNVPKFTQAKIQTKKFTPKKCVKLFINTSFRNTIPKTNLPVTTLPPNITQMYLLSSKFTPIYYNLPHIYANSNDFFFLIQFWMLKYWPLQDTTPVGDCRPALPCQCHLLPPTLIRKRMDLPCLIWRISPAPGTVRSWLSLYWYKFQ